MDIDTTPMNVDTDNNDPNNDDTATGTAALLLATQFQKLRNISEVIVHPLVLLSVADHYNRVARGTRKRVIGILLGQIVPSGSSATVTSSSTTTSKSSSTTTSSAGGSIVDVTNSFALPFEEDSKNPAIFYLDHNYLESMFHMFKKVNAKERIVGFYSTGPQIRANDLRIYDIVERYTSSSSSSSSSSGVGGGSSSRQNGTPSLSSSLPNYPAIFSIIDIRPDRSDLPVTSYKVTEEVTTSINNNNNNNNSKQAIERVFVHLPTSLGAVEAEEVGVEHLLRDIHDPTISTIASLIQEKMTGLQTLHSKLLVCQQYIQSCIPDPKTGKVAITKVNPTIIANLQTIISLLPNTMAISNPVHHISTIQQTNDMYMSIYIASVIRTVMAIHDLINNQIKYGTDGMMDRDDDEEEVKETKGTTTKEDKVSTSNEEKKE